MAKKNAMGMIYPKKIQDAMHGIVNAKIQSGYSVATVQHEEGERWIDKDGKEWEMKGGITRSIPKFQDIRVPLFCPKCSSIMGKRSKDTEVFYKFGFCLDCLIERDADMMRNGTYHAYEEKYIKSKQKGFYENAKLEIEDYLKSFDRGYLEYPTENGKLERWEGDDFEKMKKYWEGELDIVNKALYRIETGEEPEEIKEESKNEEGIME